MIPMGKGTITSLLLKKNINGKGSIEYKLGVDDVLLQIFGRNVLSRRRDTRQFKKYIYQYNKIIILIDNNGK